MFFYFLYKIEKCYIMILIVVTKGVFMNNYLNSIKKTIVSKYGTRFFPKQKKRFRKFIKEEMDKLGWNSEMIKGNIIVGDIEQVEYIFTAHYDTPGKIPGYARFSYKLFGNTSIVFSNLLIILIIILYSTFMVVLGKMFGLDDIIKLIANIPYIVLILGIFIPNKNNYNDNSSGILTLMNIAHEISDHNINKNKVAFVFFNNEEWGLLGSTAMKKYWKKNKTPLKGKKIINFDCVGNGDTILITHGRNDKLAKEMQERFKLSTIHDVERFKYNIIPLSDDFKFRKKGAIGIVFCNKSKLGKGYYIPDIHCSKDIKLNLENIELLTSEILNL